MISAAENVIEIITDFTATVMHYTQHTLRNGLRVILAPMADVQSTTVLIMTGTGSRYESARENGLAHFLEHMVFKGTAKRPTARHISSELDAIGGAYNAFTGKDRTAYYAKVPAAHSDTALDVISDVFLNARLRSADIDKERGAILQEINMYEDMPSRDIYHVFDALFYGDHPLGRPILGPKENIRAFTRADLRAYLTRCYTPHNTVVCVSGRFNKQRVLSKIRADFAQMPRTEAPTCEPFRAAQDAPRVAIKHKATDQTQFVLGMPACGARHADRYAASVLATILGGGMSSRLFMEVREQRGLAYSIHAGLEKQPDSGVLYIAAGVEHKHLAKTVRVVLDECARLTRRVVTVRELTKAKEYLKGHLVLGLEGSDDIAQFLVGQELTHSRILSPQEMMRRIDAVTAADVKRLARAYFVTEKLNLAVIGPHEDCAQELQSLLEVAY